jgi:hypothetical protein
LDVSHLLLLLLLLLMAAAHQHDGSKHTSIYQYVHLGMSSHTCVGHALSTPLTTTLAESSNRLLQLRLEHIRCVMQTAHAYAQAPAACDAVNAAPVVGHC